MASMSSINSNSSGSQAPNPPPRNQVRPNQPPPPPPVPSVPPVPPTRDSSIAISRANLNRHSPNVDVTSKQPDSQPKKEFLSQFEPMFRAIEELPPPDPFMNLAKSCTSQRPQHEPLVAKSKLNS